MDELLLISEQKRFLEPKQEHIVQEKPVKVSQKNGLFNRIIQKLKIFTHAED